MHRPTSAAHFGSAGIAARLTAAQTKSRSAAELMLTEAIMGLDGETAGPMLGRLLSHRFGAQAAEIIGDRIAREAHLCARGQ